MNEPWAESLLQVNLNHPIMDPLPSMGHMTIIMWGGVILSPIGKCTVACYHTERLFSGRIQQSEPCQQPLYFHLPVLDCLSEQL